jgi:hypothetical protein
VEQLQDLLKDVTGNYKSAFVAGVRFAEIHHGIKAARPQGRKERRHDPHP